MGGEVDPRRLSADKWVRTPRFRRFSEGAGNGFGLCSEAALTLCRCGYADVDSGGCMAVLGSSGNSGRDSGGRATDGLNCRMTRTTARISRIAPGAEQISSATQRQIPCCCTGGLNAEEQFGSFVLLYGSFGSSAVRGRWRVEAQSQKSRKSPVLRIQPRATASRLTQAGDGRAAGAFGCGGRSSIIWSSPVPRGLTTHITRACSLRDRPLTRRRGAT